MFSKSSIKIPANYHSNESSHSNSPGHSPMLTPKLMAATNDQSGRSNGLRHQDAGQDEEVRSKPRTRKQRSESTTAVSGEDGVKSIKDILNCADAQLQHSREFAEKLAKRRCGIH